MLLTEVVATSHAIAATRSRRAKVDQLVALLQRCSTEELPIVIGLLTGTPRQGRIGIGWATVSASVSATVSATVSDARNAEKNQRTDVVGLSVGDLDTLISVLINTVGAGSQASRQQLLSDAFARSSDAEIEFLSHLLMGDLRQGSLEGLMIDAVARALDVDPVAFRKARTVTGDLGELAALVRVEGMQALVSAMIVVGRPLEPMLAATSASVNDAVNELGEVSVEWKLDGARVQVHKQGSRVWLFTRNLNDITDRLPEVVDTVRALTMVSLVADGEVLGMYGDDRPVQFQDTMSRFGTDDAVEAVSAGKGHLRLFLFDLLHLDGRDVLELPLRDRRAMLSVAAPQLLVPGEITADPAVAQRVSDEALALGHEGVMVKGADSVYDAGRRGKGWRKVKPVKTLDLVVLAAEWGHGRRQGWLSNLHLGARGSDDAADAADADGQPTFVMVGKTFKGLTDALLTWQTAAFLEREVRRTGITVWVRPELVVEIAVDGVQRSTTYPGGVALRFARVKGYRHDRDATTADSIDTVRSFLP
jgi:DNA ligase 1